MDQPVQLIPLVCTRCSTRLPANVDEVAWVCSQCGQGLLLDETSGLLPLEVHYSTAVAPGTPGRPFWVAQGTVRLQRETYQRNKQAEEQALAFWSQPRTFFIPAWSCTLQELLNQTTRLLQQTPALEEGSPVPFQPVTLSPHDVQPAVDFTVTALEADRKDALRTLQATVQLGPAALWILP